MSQHFLNQSLAKGEDGTPIDKNRREVIEEEDNPSRDRNLTFDSMERQTPISSGEKRFSLPREPFPLDLLSELFPIPEDIKNTLPVVPDHVEEARNDCTYEFIEEDLLPRLASGETLTEDKLDQLASRRKEAFRERHPQDLASDFELLLSAEVELLKLCLYYKLEGSYSEEKQATANLIAEASIALKQLLSIAPDKLLHI